MRNCFFYKTKYFVLLSILLVFESKESFSQVKFGFDKLNLWTEFSFAKPKKELANFYSIDKPMQLYVGADLPFAQIKYNNKNNTGLSFAILADHDVAKFTNDKFITDGLIAKITSVGIRVKPFSELDIFDTERESEFLYKLIFSGLYVDYGYSNIRLIEIPTPTVIRNGSFITFGWAPTIGKGKKVSAFLDLSKRNYNWINALKTTSTINTFHIGFGLKITL